MDLCEETSGLPCDDWEDLELPEGEAVIVGVLEPGSELKYSDVDGQPWSHKVTDFHKLIAIQDVNGQTALVIISENLDYTETGIKG
tara:strand:- start:132 stop:389 length:258 start_codon:yes stop_codon:yes gene_type:complete